jgi:TnpA family transposase
VDNYDEILRVAGSLQLGYVTASLFISKLQARPQQNILTRALQEYGKLEKTIFILRYSRSRGLSEHGVFSCGEGCIPAYMQGWVYQ